MANQNSWDWYKPVSQDKFKEVEQTAGKYVRGQTVPRKGYLKGNYPIYGPAVGENIIRIIPPLEIAELNNFFMDIWIHRNIGPNQDFLLCNKNMFGEPCFPCSLQTGDLWDKDPDRYKSYYPDHRRIFWVLNMKLKETDEKYGYPHIWPGPKSFVNGVLGQCKDRETGVYINPEHPINGPLIYFTRIGERLNTKYESIQCGTRPVPIPPEMVNFMCLLSDELVVTSFEEGRSMMLGDEAIYSGGYGEHNGQQVDTRPTCFGQNYGDYADCTTTCNYAADCYDMVTTGQQSGREEPASAEFRIPTPTVASPPLNEDEAGINTPPPAVASPPPSHVGSPQRITPPNTSNAPPRVAPPRVVQVQDDSKNVKAPPVVGEETAAAGGENVLGDVRAKLEKAIAARQQRKNR